MAWQIRGNVPPWSRRLPSVIVHSSRGPCSEFTCHTRPCLQSFKSAMCKDFFPPTSLLVKLPVMVMVKLKEFLGGKRFGSDEELENAVITWLNELATEEYDTGILKLVDRYDKCLNVGGFRVELRYHLQSTCLQDVVLMDQTDENRLGISLGCKMDAVALTNQTFHLFGPLKQHLGSKHFADDDDVQHEEEFYAAGIGALIKRWDKCINIGGDYVEK
ncbi:hypothetical protein AVEN_122250-1 [Araneus ventricosus]|uniref:Uncharacterized protein n=1 Tax=Araneus ventricosus TaxID=182803 RepID=A0A4Y2HAH8_ARAVE|nr:hypothetical protein AVEN_122250-1 [Araneus ventricosus]